MKFPSKSTADLPAVARRRALLWAITAQLLVIAALTLMYFLVGANTARSVLLGALVVALPNCWFAWQVYLSWGMTSNPAARTQRLYRGELQKLLLMAVMCGVVFMRLGPIDATAFFASFVVMVLLGWLLPTWLLIKFDRV